VPAGTAQLVMELFTPDGRSADRLFFVGSNAAPESEPSYLSAPTCEVNTPATAASLGVPEMHLVFRVSGSCVEPTPVPGVPALRNISTRLRVGTGDRAMTAGFIVQGGVTKRVLVRAIGPSLSDIGVLNALSNPVLELHDVSTLIGRNDDWQTTQVGGVISADQAGEIAGSGFAPSNGLESALIAAVAPGSYTAIVQGVAGGTGVGVIEAYDMDGPNGSVLSNISTRGYVESGSNVMIGGFIILDEPTRVIIRAIGPSLVQFGVPDRLNNPQLELYDISSLLGRNDDWQTTQVEGIITGDQVGEIEGSLLAPSDAAESAIVVTLNPGSYTAIVRGTNDTVGNAVVEVYALH